MMLWLYREMEALVQRHSIEKTQLIERINQQAITVHQLSQEIITMDACSTPLPSEEMFCTRIPQDLNVTDTTLDAKGIEREYTSRLHSSTKGTPLRESNRTTSSTSRHTTNSVVTANQSQDY